jgi:hypothetical protein
LILFILAAFPLTLKAQFNFEPDSLPVTENGLGTPNFDSLTFEFRLWNHNSFMSIFTQITLNKNSEWKYKSGYFNHNGVLTLFPEDPKIDLNVVWRTIDSLGVRSLPSQKDINISIGKDGKQYPITEEQFDKLFRSHGVLTEVELLNKNGSRTYWYEDPVRVSYLLANSKQNWIAPEIHSMAEIERTIAKAFSISENFKKHLGEIMEKEDNKR